MPHEAERGSPRVLHDRPFKVWVFLIGIGGRLLFQSPANFFDCGDCFGQVPNLEVQMGAAAQNGKIDLLEQKPDAFGAVDRMSPQAYEFPMRVEFGANLESGQCALELRARFQVGYVDDRFF